MRVTKGQGISENENPARKSGRLDICGNLPQSVPVSESIRLSDELIAAAKQSAKLFHRSPPQQIEHWAAIGRVMEVALSYPAQELVAKAAHRRDLDAALAGVGTPEGKSKAQAVIRRTSGRIVSRSS